MYIIKGYIEKFYIDLFTKGKLNIYLMEIDKIVKNKYFNHYYNCSIYIKISLRIVKLCDMII